MFFYIRVALGFIKNWFTKVYNYIVLGRYMPDTEYNRQMFDYYSRVVMDFDTSAETPAEVWQDIKIRQACEDNGVQIEDECNWKQMRAAIYAEAMLEMVKLFWIKEDDI